MVKSNFEELIALGMNETLDNEEFKSLFGIAYKTAKCSQAHDHTADCGDSNNVLTPPLPPGTKPLTVDPNFGASSVPGPNQNQPGVLRADDNDADDDADDNDADDDADDDDNDAHDTHEDTKKSDWDDKSAALDLAIEGLLRVSAVLDSVGFEKSATTTLNLAGLMVEAAKKVKEKVSKKKKKNPFAKGKGTGSGSSGSGSSGSKGTSGKDTNDARDKAKAKAAKEKEMAAKEKAKEKEKRDTQMAKDKAAKDKAKEKADKEKAKEKADKEKADKAKKSSK
jgi:hypothetical protein